MAIQEQMAPATVSQPPLADWHPLTVNRDRAPKANFFKRWNGTA